jgi:2-dehydro-3-deoxy-D-arabinonate dehydratase
VRLVRFLTDGSAVPEVGIELDDGVRRLGVATMGELLSRPLAEIRAVAEDARSGVPVMSGTILLPPVDGRTEVWAAGVTYRRSREARMEESATADVYDLVYDSERPELFFKCAAWRAVTTGEPIGIRKDSALNVPEPELALVANRRGEIVGYTVCNDVSSRSIEGENPLYLPQAKVYAGSCALGDGIRLAAEVPAADGLDVEMTVERDGGVAWRGSANTSQMRRSAAELVSYLFRGEHFPEGAVLSTGTGIVPGMDFTLRDGDLVTVRVQDVGVLRNNVVSGREHFGWLAGSDGSRPRTVSP